MVMRIFDAHVRTVRPRRVRRIDLPYINDKVMRVNEGPVNIFDHLRFCAVTAIEGLPYAFTSLSIDMDLHTIGILAIPRP